MKHDKKKDKKHSKTLDEIFSKEYKEHLTIPNYRIGVKKDQVMGDMNLDKALAKYMFYSELTTRKNPLKNLENIPEERLAKPGEEYRGPAPVGPNPKMREAILALSLSPHIVADKLKRVLP